MPKAHFYYLNEDAKTIKYFEEQLDEIPDGFVFCGMSHLPIKGAAGYYTKNQSGYSLVNGDEPPATESESPDEQDERNLVSEN